MNLKSLFSFDRPTAEFELLETESGEPSFWGSWQGGVAVPEEENAQPDQAVSACMAENRERLFSEYQGKINPDLILRQFLFAGKIPALAAFLNGMADGETINDFILRPGMESRNPDCAEDALAQFAMDRVFCMQEAELCSQWSTIKSAVAEGRTAVFLDGDPQAILMDTRGFVSRSVSVPQNEKVILGPHEGFTENIRTNITLLRRIIKTDDFVCEFRKSGGSNNNSIAIVYRHGVANPTLVNEVKRRFGAIDTVMVTSIGTLEQLTESHPFSPLPQSLSTERPDRVAAQLMQGHVAVLCEGSPLANVMPATLFTLMSSGQDAYVRAPIGALVRMIRYIGTIISILMPAYFLALAMHHQGMLSGEILATVVASRNVIFLPLPIEMIFLLFAFQLLREATISVPGSMSQGIGIIGGLLLGQAAVAANIVSKVVLIIVALAGLGNFTVPDYSLQLAVSYYRVTLVLSAWLGGLLGMFATILITVALLSSIKSYGVPFLTPVSPKANSAGPWTRRRRILPQKRHSDEMNTEAQTL